MSGIAIVTDSTAYIPDEFVRKYGLHVAPQILIWGEETLRDGIDIMPDDFYARLKTATKMPTTSQVTIAYFKELFEKLAGEGKQIVAVLISSKLSGTISSAVQAKEMLPKASVEIVDSRATAMALGFQVLAAARAAEAGKSLAEVTEIARRGPAQTGILFTVETLEFLHRGGRIGGAARLLGTALNLKPVLELVDGRIEPVERVRTKAKARARVLELVAERVKDKPNLRLATIHAAAAGEAQELLEEASRLLNPVESFPSLASPVIGNHAGPGTVGLAYSTDF